MILDDFEPMWSGTIKDLKEWLEQFEDTDRIDFMGGALGATYEQDIFTVAVNNIVEVNGTHQNRYSSLDDVD